MSLVESERPMESEPPTRRRGAVLEEAILDAAWAQLMHASAGDFSYEAVASRAGTSRSVLYRRWPQRELLLKAAIRHGGAKVSRTVPDTGSLREDMTVLLLEMNHTMHEFLTLLAGQLEMMRFAEPMTPEEIRNLYVGDRALRSRIVLDRAIERGEADADRVTDLVLSVPANLVRERIMLTQRTLSRREVEAILDQVFLPLVAPRG